ncbi:MAG TPA: Rieske (2Fe-2S) protein [Chitinophagales bacterium]|nr:Rieske (2Fe-2S) protein [Chitinophagales bacterium]
MERKEFLKKLGYSAAAFFIADYLTGCGNIDAIPNVDFYLDLTDPQNNNLLNLGGFIYVSNVIVFKGLDNNYYALSKVCTHEGCDVEYNVSQNQITCPCHGSHFDISGNVTMGPAASPLFEYTTQLIGTQLHVFTP